MVLQITQETFDNAVQENVEILGLSETEAVEEAVKQFETQGVDLSKIIKDIAMSKQEFEEITAAVKKLEQLQKSKSSSESINATLEVLRTECERGLQQKVAAGKADAYFVLLNVFEAYKDKVVRGNTLKTLIALMTKQPDLLEDRGVDFIINNLKDHNEDPEIQRLLLRWTKECCVMHEMNRQKIFGAHFVDIIKSLLKDTTTVEVIREVLAVSRALVLDDDVRVEFGMAHEHARVIASETLCALMTLLSKFKGEEQLTQDIILTLTALMVRSEFCKKVEDAGGLDLIKNVMETFSNTDKIIRQCFKLIKALGGNDDCKVHLIKKGYVNILKECLSTSMENPATVVAGLAAVSALTLRSPENSKAFFEGGIPEVIVEAMKHYPDHKPTHKTASWAIRNMVSRSKYQNQKFLELGVEEILQQDLKKFKEIEYDIKAALRDLGCKVNFKEEWTGKGGALTSGFDRNENDD
ncbi:armadillo repeat-containing protein 6 homolog [Anthonomus grandis grandis]|uniref:armadillo repeat-containing protein 6 homolog n=1 Tax=Anthonomus grandis grandis TaxID=2921223 RepID=UPI00216678BA|nr:armadillo repeat-containing protein 6 homolog [Anthonomus grandis grandis]